MASSAPQSAWGRQPSISSTNQSTNQPTNQPTVQAATPSNAATTPINQSTNQSINQSKSQDKKKQSQSSPRANQSTNQSTNQPTNQSSTQSNNQQKQSTNQSINQSTNPKKSHHSAPSPKQAQTPTNQSINQSTNQQKEKPAHQSTNQSINQSKEPSTPSNQQSTNASTNSSTNQSTNPSTTPSSAQSTNQSTNLSTNQPTNQSTAQSTAQSTNQPTNQSTEFVPSSQSELSQLLQIGNTVHLLSITGDVHVGEVFIYDQESQALAIENIKPTNQSINQSTNTEALRDWTLFNARTIKVSLVKKASSINRSLPRVDPARLQAKESKAIIDRQSMASKIGRNVSAEGQKLFDILSKLYPARWDMTDIVLMDALRLKAPYDSKCLSGGSAGQQQRIKMLIEAERAKMGLQ